MAELKWWQKAVFYQIYPRSFADGQVCLVVLNMSCRTHALSFDGSPVLAGVLNADVARSFFPVMRGSSAF